MFSPYLDLTWTWKLVFHFRLHYDRFIGSLFIFRFGIWPPAPAEKEPTHPSSLPKAYYSFIFNSMPIRDGVITKIRRFVSISKTWSQSLYSLVTPDKDESVKTVLTVYIMRFIARCLDIHSGYVVGLHKHLNKTKQKTQNCLCEDNANKNIKWKKSAFLLFSLSSIFSFTKRAIVFLHFLYSSYLEILLLMFYILISLIKQNIMLSKTVKEAVNILYTSIPVLLPASICSCFPRMQIFLFCRMGML